MSDSESSHAGKAARPASPGVRDPADEGPVNYQTLEESDGDDLMGAIGIDLEQSADIIAGNADCGPGECGTLDIDFDKIASNVSRAVLSSAGGRINRILASAIEEAVGMEMEKLKDILKK